MPFPHVERRVYVPRPALIVSREPLGPDGLLIWAAMITRADGPDWRGDLPIADPLALGLRFDCKVRTAKVQTFESTAARKIGHVPKSFLDEVLSQIAEHLGLQFNPAAVR